MMRGHAARIHIWGIAGLLLVLTVPFAAPATAQQGQPAPQNVPEVPERNREPQGLIAEPDWLERAIVFGDRHLSGGGGSNGFYVNTKSPLPGAGWLTVGPGYRHWFKNDAVLVDGSAGVSWRGYKVAQARVELPKLLRSRLTLGAQYRWQDFRAVKSFGEGSRTAATALTRYQLKAQNVVGYASVRPLRWMSLAAQLGWLAPTVDSAPGDEPDFAYGELSLTADTRDFPDHPTRGAVVRVATSRFNDRDRGDSSFDRREAEVAGFIPLAGSRIVLATHGWLVASDTDPGQSVPFYLQPSLGGGRSLRSFSDYRFHDRHMLQATAEVRVALMTHVDLAGFVDAGNVAARPGDLDLAKRSYGAGLRFHSRRDTFLRIDVAHGSEGWRTMFSLSEPLSLSRLERRTAPAPFVP